MVLKHPENSSTKKWAIYERLLQMGHRTLYIWGPPGIGKTYLAYRVGVDEDKVMAVTLTDETPAAELRGHYLLGENGSTYWHDGPFTVALRKGYRLVVNEIGHANDDVQGILYPFLEDPSTARLTLPNGETVFPTDGFHVVATDNFAPDKLPEALHDRFGATLKLDDPHPDALANLPPEFWYCAVQGRHEDDDLSGISARQWNNLCINETEFGLKMGCALTWGPEAGKTVWSSIMAAWTRKTELGSLDQDLRPRMRTRVEGEYGVLEIPAEATDAAE